MVKTLLFHVCDLCESRYTTQEEAIACEELGLFEASEDVQVGDFVEISIGKAYGWHNAPDSIWTRIYTDEERKKTLHGAMRYALRAVVTHVGTIKGHGVHDGHHVTYSLLIPEPPWLKEQPEARDHHVWTRFRTHISFTKLDPTPEFLAWKAEHFSAWEGKASRVLL